MAGDENTTTGPSSWRDVYGLVQGVRDDLSVQIEGVRSTVADLVQQQEHRLTVVETVQAAHAVQLAAATTNIDLLKEQQVKEDARTKALESARTNSQHWRQWAIGAACALISAGATVALVLH